MIDSTTIKIHDDNDNGIYLSVNVESGFKTLLPRLIKYNYGYILYLTLFCIG